MDEKFRENHRPYEELTDKVRFLKRYLKEHGAYAAYRRNIHDEKCYKVWQRNYPNWTFKDAVKYFGVRLLITKLIVWNATNEGWDYWNEMHQNFIKLYDEKFRYKK